MAAIATAGSGNWSSVVPNLPWPLGVAPVSGDTVTIGAGHTVTVDGAYTVGTDPGSAANPANFAASVVMTVSGTLKFSRAVNSSVTLRGSIAKGTAGVIDMGTDGTGGTANDPIPGAVTAQIIFTTSGNLSTANAKYGHNPLTNGGKTYARSGAPRKRNTVLLQAEPAGASTVLAGDAANWAVGDRICVAVSSGTASQYDERTVNAIAANPQPGYPNAATVTLGAVGAPATPAPLTNAKASGVWVGNFSSNVVVTSNVNQCIFWREGPTTATGVRGLNLQDLVFEKGAAALTAYGTEPAYFGLGINLLTGVTATEYAAVSSCACYRPYTHGMGAFNYGQTFTMSDCAVFSVVTASTHADFFFSGTSSTMNDCGSYGAHPAVSPATFGALGQQVFNRCWLVGGTYNVIGTQANSMTFNDCYAGACSYVQILVAAKNNWNRCFFGTGPGNPSISTAIMDTAQAYVTESYLRDCTFQSGVAVTASMANLPSDSVIRVSNKDGNPLVQENYAPAGKTERDNVAFLTGSTSIKFAPASAVSYQTAEFQIYAPQNKRIDVNGFIMKDAAFSMANPPTVTLSGLGITPAVFTLAGTATNYPGSGAATSSMWEPFTVSGMNSGNNGMLTVTVSVRGTAGSVWLDSVSALTPAAVNSGDLEYWADAVPVKALSANFVAAADIWASATAANAVPGSFGELLGQDVLTEETYLESLP